MEQTEQSECAYLARTPTFPGYWGTSKDGPHHAIASCCDAGANRFGIFAVYRGGPSLTASEMDGSLEWAKGEPEPVLEGIYTASGMCIGENLAELAEDVRRGRVEPDEYALDRDTVRNLKAHKPE